MFLTKVRASAANFEAGNGTAATAFETWFAGATIGIVLMLKFAALAVNVAIIGIRIAAEINALLQDFKHCFI